LILAGFVRTDRVVEFKVYAELLKKNAEVERKILGQVERAYVPAILSLLLLGLAVVGVFIDIPFVSNYTFWFSVAAYMIRLSAWIPHRAPYGSD